MEYTKNSNIQSNQTYTFSGKRLDYYIHELPWIDCRPYYCSSSAKSDTMPVAFYLKNLKHVTLDFGGATLVFHGRIIPFIFDNCSNITLKNLSIDYDRPFYTQGHVLSVEKSKLNIKIDPGFDFRVEDGFLYACSESWEKRLNTGDCLLWLYDRTGEKSYPITLGLFGPEIFPGKNPPLPIIPISVTEEGDTLTLQGDFPEEWDYNDGRNSLIFTHEPRDKNTITFLGCRDMTVDNLNLIHGASMGIVAIDTENITMDHYNMCRGERLVTNNADAFHCYNCHGEIVLKNSHMDGLLDDTVNIHNNYMVVAAGKKTQLTVACKGAGINKRLPFFTKGEKIGLFRGATLDKKGEAVLFAVEYDPETELYSYIMDREIAGVEPGDIIENLTAQPRILIEDCVFGSFRGTMRLQSRNLTVVRNCRFENPDVPILFTGDTTYWYESGPIGELIIENCYLNGTLWMSSNVTPTPSQLFYHGHITIRNCEFATDYPIHAMLLSRLTLIDNIYAGKPYATLDRCGRVESDQPLEARRQ